MPKVSGILQSLGLLLTQLVDFPRKSMNGLDCFGRLVWHQHPKTISGVSSNVQGERCFTLLPQQREAGVKLRHNGRVHDRL